MGKAKGKVSATVYIPVEMWQKIREMAEPLPTGQRKVSDVLVRLLKLGLEAYERENAGDVKEAVGEGEGEKRPEREEAREIEVELYGEKFVLEPA